MTAVPYKECRTCGVRMCGDSDGRECEVCADEETWVPTVVVAGTTPTGVYPTQADKDGAK